MMYNYKFYDLQFSSEICFSGLTEKDGTPEVQIFYGLLPEPSGEEVLGGFIRGTYHNLFDFVIRNGSEIIINRRQDIDETAILSVVQGEIMSALLRQRGLLVLHACCVRDGEKVIGFVGGSTWGKSTLAEYFCQSGYFLLSDDILAIDMSGEAPVALSSYPEIRLRKEAGNWLREDYESLPQRSSNINQRISNREKSFRTDSAVLTNLYILQQEFADSNEIIQLNVTGKLSELILHTRSKTLLTQEAHLRDHLSHCSALISKIPIRRLERADSLELLPALKDLIENDL